MKNLANNFINLWNDKMQYLLKNDKKIKPKEFNSGLELKYFLLDKYAEEDENYLFKAAQEFIKIQNEFMNSILAKLEQNNLFNEIKEGAKHSINLLNASENQIINFNISENKIRNILFSCCFRDITINKEKVDYSKYRELKMNLEKIEKNFGFLLSEKKLFNEEIKDSVVYIGEEYLHELTKKDVFNEFCENYKQKNLNQEQKQLIYDYYENFLSNSLSRCKKIMKDFKVFFYYTNQFIQDSNKFINVIINKMQEDFE